MKKLIVLIILLISYSAMGATFYDPLLGKIVTRHPDDFSTYDAGPDGIIDAGAFDLTGVLGTAYDSEAELKALMTVKQAAEVADGGTLTLTAGYLYIICKVTQTTETI